MATPPSALRTMRVSDRLARTWRQAAQVRIGM
jgi:hypothetical protein